MGIKKCQNSSSMHKGYVQAGYYCVLFMEAASHSSNYFYSYENSIPIFIFNFHPIVNFNKYATILSSI